MRCMVKRLNLTLQSKNKMIPGQPLIYERANGVVYARYRDPPHNKKERWVIGGDPGAVARAQGKLLDYSEWLQLCDLAETNPTLNKLMNKLVNTYYMVKEEDK
jgi:hypothetical protein